MEEEDGKDEEGSGVGRSRDIEEEEEVVNEKNDMGRYRILILIKAILYGCVYNALLIFIAPPFLSLFYPSETVDAKVSVFCSSSASLIPMPLIQHLMLSILLLSQSPNRATAPYLVIGRGVEWTALGVTLTASGATGKRRSKGRRRLQSQKDRTGIGSGEKQKEEVH